MENIVLEIPFFFFFLEITFDLLLMRLKQHLYFRLLWPNRLNYMLIHRLILKPWTKLPFFILIVAMLSQSSS